MKIYTLELPHSALLRWEDKDPKTGKSKGFPLVMVTPDGKKLSDHASIEAAHTLGEKLQGVIAENELPDFVRLKKSCTVCAAKGLPVVYRGQVLSVDDDGKDDDKVELHLTCSLLTGGKVVL